VAVEVDHFFENDLGVDLAGIPTSYSFDVTHLPKIQIGLDPIELEPITVNPLDVSVRLKEIPSVRTHIPALFTLGLSVLGYELVCARLCGEAQVITEPYEPNPCEHCGKPHRTPTSHVPVPAKPKPEVPK
jgi:hypothetical protein